MTSYVHGHAAAVLRSHRWRTVENSAGYLLPHLRPGMSILDVGCGPGTITIDLAERVTPGRVVGVDPVGSVIAEATALGGTAEFLVGDVSALDVADDTFDIVHAHQVLQHLGDPVAALREMRRVAKPGGIIAARDADYAAMTWFPESRGIEDWLRIYRAVARESGGEPDAGRRLAAWARDADLEDVDATAGVWCFAAEADRVWWANLWADRMLESRVGERAVAGGHCTRGDLARIATAWREWAAEPAGWFSVLHGEIVCRA
ncbi:methyltransferase family protein [Stackebrandtia endophytica]|uniref:Methyltransferase family protein n=1 Tax=Stackebrandtia endophytica TaxID=1496996 RepID=A0A543B197_9ACTN|nr:methyltransferase domain-containing protein [Stackebrandtia endophytica]TQL78604.1 methyltransferase family protein [Stackebrandtia endophytica]